MAVKRRLVARGWQEVITFSFVSSAWESTLFPGRDARAAPIAVLNPDRSHLDVMRTTLAGGLIDVLRTNLARKQDRVRVFEVGPLLLARRRRATISRCASAGSPTGTRCPSSGDARARSVDLFDVKGDLEALVAPRALTTERPEHAAAPPGASRARAASTDRRSAGSANCIRASSRQFDLPRAPVLFELDLAALLARRLPAARPVSRLPVVRRDLAVVVDDGLPAQEILTALESAKPAARRCGQAVRRLSGPGNWPWQEKPCDSGAYAGY